MRNIFLILIFITAGILPAFAQPAPQPVVPLKVKNSGVVKGYVDTIDFTTNQTVTVSGGVATVTASGGSSTNGLNLTIAQTSHGFVIGNLLIFNGVRYQLAEADSAADAEVIGIVSSVIDANNFVLTVYGYVTGLSGLTPGGVYFLSTTTIGAMTATNPTDAGAVSKPVLVADSASSGFFYNMRGSINPGVFATPFFSVTYLGQAVTYNGNPVTYNHP